MFNLKNAPITEKNNKSFFVHIKSKQEQWQWQVTSRFQTKDQLFPYKEFLTDFVVFALFCF